MAQPHAGSGTVVSLRPLAAKLGEARTTALLKARQLEVVRIVLRAGDSLREHAVDGEITLQCLEGSLLLATPEARLELGAGDFVHLAGGVPHALTAHHDCSVLLTICLPGTAAP